MGTNGRCTAPRPRLSPPEEEGVRGESSGLVDEAGGRRWPRRSSSRVVGGGARQKEEEKGERGEEGKNGEATRGEGSG